MCSKRTSSILVLSSRFRAWGNVRVNCENERKFFFLSSLRSTHSLRVLVVFFHNPSSSSSKIVRIVVIYHLTRTNTARVRKNSDNKYEWTRAERRRRRRRSDGYHYHHHHHWWWERQNMGPRGTHNKYLKSDDFGKEKWGQHLHQQQQQQEIETEREHVFEKKRFECECFLVRSFCFLH